MKSIKNRLVGNFVLVIIITLAIVEILLINVVKQYYYNSIEEMISNQIELSAELYSRYFSSYSIEDIIMDNIDFFWTQTSAQVQILDLSGNILMDSIGVIESAPIQSSDFKKAIKGEKGKWVGKVAYHDSKVMAISYPLKSDDETVGLIRFITSLKETNKTIMAFAFIFILVGLVVVIISGLVSIILSNGIVRPLREITATAEHMAAGQLKARNPKRYDGEIGKLSETLNFMAEEILKKEQVKNQFISSVSHELRTPLTSIKGWAITLKSGDFNDKTLLHDGLEIIEKESDRLTFMVEELLDFSKFISGNISLNKEDVDIVKVMEHITKQLSLKAANKSIDFNLSYEENLPLLLVDENKIKQVFINILDNAFRFTPENGQVIFSARQERGYVIVCVTDNGYGISKEDLPYIKDKFYKGKSSNSNNGLGLSICDEIIKLHDGELDIKSELGQGTDVCVLLPIE